MGAEQGQVCRGWGFLEARSGVCSWVELRLEKQFRARSPKALKNVPGTCTSVGSTRLPRDVYISVLSDMQDGIQWFSAGLSSLVGSADT